MTEVTCFELSPDRLQDYLTFFDHKAFTDNPRWAGCYCYFPLHDPEKTQWHERSATENRQAICGSVSSGQARGVLAYAGEEVVGWCSAGPWSQFPMLRDYAEDNTDTLGVIFCFVIAPDRRGQGIASALLDAACGGLLRSGMTAVQAKPKRQAEGAAANHFGPLSMYLKAGFRVVRDLPEGDVFVRKSLV